MAKAPIRKRAGARRRSAKRAAKSRAPAVPRPRAASPVATALPGEVGDEAILRATGKRRDEWFALLDGAGASKLDHRAIAILLFEEGGCPPWWSQTITVAYERARGLRERYQTAEGFRVSASRTYPVPLARLYAAWSDRRVLARWSGVTDFTVRTARPEKSLRITWPDGTRVEANFTARAPEKSSVAVQHGKLAGAAEVERRRREWAVRLDRLGEVLAGSAPRRARSRA